MAHISLCMIVGNEAAHILRCLAAFADGFDELSLVRACGAAAADDTEAMAREWCAANGKVFLFSEYRNGPEARDWQHVDDFAAARNASYAQATGDWLLWCDADDVLKDGTQAAQLREAIASAGDAECLLFAYDVPGTNKAPLRERIISRRLWQDGRRWRHAVHENLICEPGDKRRVCAVPVWQHAPVAAKPRSHDRNLRLLGHGLRDAGTQLFYVHQEHHYARSKEKAREFGLLALGFPNLHDSFRVEILMNLGRNAPTPKEAREWFGRAFAEMPHLREPLAALVLTYLEAGDHLRALDCVERMLAIPEPTEHRRPWAYEAKWYGWAGDDLADRIYRLNGLPTLPRAKPARISLIHATRGRPQQAWECRERWLGMASDPGAVEYVIGVDADDKGTLELARQFKHAVVEPGSCVRAWNAAADLATGDVLVQLSDDWTPSFGWDAAILRELGDTSDERVLAISDGYRKDDLMCMAILTRARWVRQGREMFSPEYQSVFSDNEFSHRAWRDGVVIDARERLTFTHAHPFFDKGAKWDATYEAQNARDRYERGLATFLRRNPDASFPATGND